MNGIFDGLASTLNDVFGAAITIMPSGGQAVDVRGVLREEMLEVLDENGEPVVLPWVTLKLLRADAAGMVRGDTVQAGGRNYRVRHPVPSSSPAVDRFETFVLEDVT
ncbi:MAG: head-tail joining protein [Marinibacterium sp.]